MALSSQTTTLNSGTPQVETATVVGTITLAGNATFTVTGVGITGSPLAVAVAVLLNDTASIVASKAAVAIAATAVGTLYDVASFGDKVILTRKNAAADDATLNVASTNGTCTGLTAQATSANTVLGVAITKLVDIIDYPDTGSAPSKLDTTTLSAVKYKTNMLGLQDSPDFTFTALYTKSDFTKIVALNGGTHQFTLVFSGSEGTFTWNGQIAVFAAAAGVDEVRKMTITISAYTEPVVS